MYHAMQVLCARSVLRGWDQSRNRETSLGCGAVKRRFDATLTIIWGSRNEGIVREARAATRVSSFHQYKVDIQALKIMPAGLVPC